MNKVAIRRPLLLSVAAIVVIADFILLYWFWDLLSADAQLLMDLYSGKRRRSAAARSHGRTSGASQRGDLRYSSPTPHLRHGWLSTDADDLLVSYRQNYDDTHPTVPGEEPQAGSSSASSVAKSQVERKESKTGRREQEGCSVLEEGCPGSDSDADMEHKREVRAGLTAQHKRMTSQLEAARKERLASPRQLQKSTRDDGEAMLNAALVNKMKEQVTETEGAITQLKNDIGAKRQATQDAQARRDAAKAEQEAQRQQGQLEHVTRQEEAREREQARRDLPHQSAETVDSAAEHTTQQKGNTAHPRRLEVDEQAADRVIQESVLKSLKSGSQGFEEEKIEEACSVFVNRARRFYKVRQVTDVVDGEVIYACCDTHRFSEAKFKGEIVQLKDYHKRWKNHVISAEAERKLSRSYRTSTDPAAKTKARILGALSNNAALEKKAGICN
ncbi:unnamed protein product [Amoebophrya sp. A25]|nr:unnamed protein product [Amoebophrya sp. A25]|eukprot:GSA25T00010412001.1